MSRMSGAVLVSLGVAFGAAGYLQAARLQEPPRLAPGPSGRALQRQSSPPSAAASATSPQRAVFDKYCITCHNERLRTAGLALDTVDATNVSASVDLWEKVVQKLRSESMPPAGVQRPDKTTYISLAAWLETELDRVAAARPNPGRPTIHRLNRFEYTNAIRDLLALDVDGRSLLPADEAGYGFDNIADVLSLSPGLMERYMSAAWKISRLAIPDPTTIRLNVETYRVSRNLVQEDRVSEDLPWMSRGGIAIRHHFPVDGEYTIRIRLQRQFNLNRVRGLAEANQLDVRLDSALIKRFTVGGECDPAVPTARCTVTGVGLATSEYERSADEGLEVRFPAKAGTRIVGIAFLERTAAPEGVSPSRLPVQSNSFWNNHDRVEAGVETMFIEGPFDARAPAETPSSRRILGCRPTSTRDEKPCAAKILGALARRAYRRPVTNADLETLLGFYEAGRVRRGFEEGIRFALERLLVSPQFLFRIERDPKDVAARVYRISDLELASRLSFFLWSSIPDDELLDVAGRGKLKDPEILEQQVRRMLEDARASALVSNFGGQWLYLRNMRAVAPDPSHFPEFDDNLREAFQRETDLFLESQLREDRSVVELLTADYTFVNERLARHYKIPNVYGNHFRRVTFSDDTRAGLLGQGSILTVTSYSTRTSPVVRGKWLLDNLLGAPPPPPPPNVPPLEENDQKKPTSVRERLEQHRRNPACAVCHTRMDPMGFALENFDAIGRWRANSEGNAPVNASGVLPDGTKFSGPAEFRNALLAHREEFVKTVIQKLLTYALGRGLEAYDMPAVRTIMRDSAPSGYRWSSLILNIAKSVPFQMRRRSES